MTADLTPPELLGGVVGAETGRLDVGADLTLNFTEPIKPGSSGNIRLYRDSGALIETFSAATSTALEFVADTITINPTWDLDGSQGYYLSVDANSILDLSDNPFAGVSDTTTLRFLTDVETRGALGSSPIRDEFPGTSQEQIGDHRAIYIRVTFPDVNRSPNALADAVADMDLTSQAFIESSKGVMPLTVNYTPVVTLPFSHAWLTTFDSATNGLGLVQTAAQAEAAKLGYDMSNYDVVMVRLDRSLRSGASWGGGDSVWLAWGGFSVIVHEGAHALGVGHAKSIDWNGKITEYGSTIDWMGDGNELEDQFGINTQHALGWIDGNDILESPGSGIYRVHALDSGRKAVGEFYGLRQSIPSDVIGSAPTYTLEYRPRQRGGLVDSAVLLRNDHLIDLTPGTPGGFNDGGIRLGQTFQIPSSDSYFTVLHQGDGFLDIVYQQGPFPANQAPSATFTASATTVKRFDEVTFTADALDADGDQLVYSWSFSDGVHGSGKTYKRTFTQGTAQNVSATLKVSDMRGGVATVAATLAVGAAATASPASFGAISSPSNARPLVAVIASDAFGAEGNDTAAFTVQRIGSDFTQALEVQLSFAGSANQASDVGSLAASVVIPADEASATVTITPVDDTVIEAAKQLTVSLVANAAYDISSQNSSAKLTIGDNDSPVVTVEALDAIASEPTSTGRDMGSFLIRRTGPTDSSMTVYYGLTGSAYNGGDYSRLDGQVVIPAGQSSVVVTINPLDDEVGEVDETVTLTLTTFNDIYSVGRASNAAVTIRDHADVPTISVRASTSGNNLITEGSSGSFSFHVLGGTGEAISIQYVVSGTADNGTDYATVSGTLLVPAGGRDRTVTLPIQTLADGVAENDESLVVTLSTSSSYHVGLDSSAQLAIGDAINTATGEDRVRASRHIPTNDYSSLADPAEANAKAAYIYVYRDNATDNRQALTVTYSLAGNATPAVDYAGRILDASRTLISTFTPAATGNTLTIPANAEGVIVELVPVLDSTFEGTETIEFNLVSVSGSASAYPLGINRSISFNLLDQDPGPVLIGFETNATLVGESGDSSGTVRQIPVVLNQASAEPVTVRYRASGGSALGLGSDWTFLDAANNPTQATTGVLTFAPGETRKSVAVSIQRDRIPESQESFKILLEAPTRAALNTASTQHQVTIYDAVPSGLIKEERWAGSDVYTNNSWDTQPVTYVSYLSGLTPAQNVGSNYSRRLSGLITAPSTGNYEFYIAGDDSARLYLSSTDSAANKSLIASYSGWTGFQVWDKFSSQKSIAIPLIAGNQYYVEVQHQEGGSSDHVSVAWTGPGINTITPIVTSSPVATIENRYVRFLNPASTVTEGQATDILVTLDRPNPNASITVDLAIVAGATATQGVDFTLGTSTLTFAPGEQTKRLDVQALSDSLNESREKVVLRLTSASGAQLSGPTDHILNISDAQAPQISPTTGFVTRNDSAGTLVAQMTATAGTGRTLQSWEILAGNPRVQDSETGAFAIDSQGRVTVANAAALPLSSYQLDLVVRGTDNLGSSAVSYATVVMNGSKIVEERWDNTNTYDSNSWSSTPSSSSVLASFDTPQDVGDYYSRRITGIFSPAQSGNYSFWVAALDQGRLTIAPLSNPNNETEIIRTGQAGYQAWDDNETQQSPPQALVAGERYILRAYQREAYWGDYLSVAWSGPGITRQVIPASAFLPGISEKNITPATFDDTNPTSVSTYSLSSTASTDTGLASSIQSGQFTRDPTLGLSGTAVTGATVRLYSGTNLIGQTVANSAQTWTITTPALSEGEHTLLAEVTDSHGNVAITAPVTVTIRTKIELSSNLMLLSQAATSTSGTSTGGALGAVEGIVSHDEGVVAYRVLSGNPFEEQRWSGSDVYNNNTWESVTPNYTGTLTGLTTAVNVGNDYSRRIRGQISVPTTGAYTFYLASDDGSRLFLSTSNLATDKVQIASIDASGWTNFQEWQKYSSATSTPVTLQEGQSYYIEVQHLEGGGGDHVSVGWTGPGITQITPITLPSNLYATEGTTGRVQLVTGSAANASVPAAASTTYGGISPNGRYVVFGSSSATAFGSGGNAFADTNPLTAEPYSDLFVFDRQGGTTRLATARSAASTASRQAQFVGVSKDSQYLIYTSDYAESIAGFSAPGKTQPTSWVLVSGGFPTPTGKSKVTTLRVADIDPSTLTYALSGGFITNKGVSATVSAPTVTRSTGLLSFWVQALDNTTTKAVKLELSDSSDGILVKAIAAKYTGGDQPNFNWNTSGTNGTVATSSNANGYGVSLLEARGSALNAKMLEEGAVASKDVIAFNLGTGEQRLLSHSATSSNNESGAANVGNVTLSADGRYVLFTAADASRLGNSGTPFTDSAPSVVDLFATDLQTGEIRLLSHSAGNLNASAGVAVTLLGTSADGAYAVFSALDASAFGFTDSASNVRDLFSVSLADGTIQLLSRASSANATTSAANEVTFETLLGNHVYFSAKDATRFGFTSDGDATKSDLLRYDLSSGEVDLLSHVVGSSSQALNGTFLPGSITASSDGRYVAFAVDLRSSYSDFTVSISGGALLLADTETGTIRMLNASNSNGTSLSYGAWAGIENQTSSPRFFTPDNKALVWQSSYLGWISLPNKSFGTDVSSQYGTAALIFDLSSGLADAGTVQQSSLLSHTSASNDQVGKSITLLGVSHDSRLAFFSSADASSFGNAGTAFTDSSPTNTDIFAVDIRSRVVELVTGEGLASFGQSATFHGVGDGGGVIFSLNDVAGLNALAGSLADTNGSGNDLLARRYNLIDLASGDDTVGSGTGTDNFTTRDDFTLQTFAPPGMPVQLLDNGTVVAQQTAPTTGLLRWDLSNVADGQHTYTLSFLTEQIPILLANSAGSSSLTVTVQGGNQAPTDIELASSQLAENAGTNAIVGTLTSTDPNAGNTFTYTLVSGSGDTDNDAFQISGAELRAKQAFDFESKSSYSIRIRTTDQGGLTFDKAFTISVTNVNESPSNIALSKSSLVEQAGANAVVGTLTTTDPDAENTFTYSLVSGEGDTGNAAFNLSGNQLRATSSLNFATQSSYSVRVRSTDQGGLSFEKSFTVTVTQANRAPTDLSLSSSTVAENAGSHAVVGTLTSTDPDPDNTFVYSLVSGTGDSGNNAFNISGNTLRATSSLNFEAQSSYSVRLRTTDQEGLSYEKAFTITVTNVNESPTDVGLSTSSIAENAGANAIVGSLTTTDPDVSDSFTYALASGAGDTDNHAFTISGSMLQAIASLDFESKSSYAVRLRTTDLAGAAFEKTFTITVTNVNEAPTGLALSKSSISENAGENAVVGNLTATDPDAGSTFTYTLVSGEGDSGNSAFNIAGNQLRATSSLDVAAQNSYSVRVRATDQGGLSFDSLFTITVTPVNRAPTDLSLSNATVAENAGANALVGTLSTTDPDTNNTFTYALVSGTGDTDNTAFVLSGNQLRAISSLNFEGKDSYAVRLRTTDQDGLSFEKAFTIRVTNVNETPTDLALSSSTLNENAGVNVVIGTLSTNDPDAGNTFTYSLVAGSGDTDNGTFNISGNQLRASASLNFEGKSSYSIRVRSTDQGGLSFDKVFSITVSDQNESPTDISLSNATIAENAGANAAVGTLTTTDPDVGNTFTYTLISGSGDTDNASFQVVGDQLRATASFDFESRTSYSVRLRTTDPSGLSFEESFAITVTNVNETPTDIALSGTSLAENAGTNAAIGSLTTDDPDAGNSFTYTFVSGTGDTDNGLFNLSGSQLRATSSLNFESKSNYSIRLRSTDQGGLSFDKVFSINVTDINEAPTNLILSSSSIAENAGADAVIGILSTTDSDAANSHTYAFSSGTGDTDNSSFSISGTELRANSSFNFETKSSYSVRLRTVDQGGLSFDKVFTISVTNVNEAPTDLALSSSSIAENAGVNAVVGSLSTTDPDANNTFTYSLVSGSGDTDNSAFNVSGSQLRANSSFDFETNSSYSVRLRATDQGGLSVEKALTVTVTDTEEAVPTVTLQLSRSAIGEAGGSTILTATLSSASSQAVTVQLAFGGSATPTSDYTPSSTVILIPVGSLTGTITITAVQDTLDEPNETIIVDIQSVTNAVESGIQQVTATIVDDDYPAVSVTPVEADRVEGHAGPTAFTFVVRRSGDLTSAASVEWAVSGTGSNPANIHDFGGLFPRGGVSFGVGASEATVTINVTGDRLVEPDEGFQLELRNAVNLQIGTGTAEGMIRNDDLSLSIEAVQTSREEGNSGSTPFTFNVVRSGLATVPVTVSFAVSGLGNDPARAADFSGGTWPAGTLEFAPNEITKTLTVAVATDTVQEPNEDFRVTLTNPTMGTLATATADGRILNDDTTVLLIDDGDALYQQSGTWTRYRVYGGYASSDRTADMRDTSARSGAQATYRFENLTPATAYSFAASWLAHSSRSSQAPYTVSGIAEGSRTYLVNQQVAPNDFTEIDRLGREIAFESLGSFVTDSTGQVTVTLGSATSGTVIADAIKLTPITAAKIDIRQGGTSYFPNESIALGTVLQGDRFVQSFTVMNLGVAPLVLQPVTTSGALSLSGSNFTAGQEVAPGASVMLDVELDTTATGLQSGTITIPSNDPSDSPFVLTLSATSVSTLIVDDGDPTGFSTSGSWKNWSGIGGYASTDKADDLKEAFANSGATATYTFPNLVPGNAYQVSATWLAYTNRPSQAPYRISGTTGGAQTILIDQRLAPVGITHVDGRGKSIGFQPLGNFAVDTSGTLTVTLTAANAGNTIADAIRIQPVPALQVSRGSTELYSNTSLSLGSRLQNDSIIETITVTNRGTQNLLLQPVTTTGQVSIQGPNFSINQTLSPGSSQSFQIRVSSTELGTRSGVVTITTSDSRMPSFQIPVSAVVNSGLVVDDGDSSGFQTTGSWSTWVGYGGYAGATGGGDVRQTLAGTGATATYLFPGLTPGATYQIAATWLAHSNRTTQAPYQIRGVEGGNQNVFINQRQSPTGLTFPDQRGNAIRFQSLGNFRVDSSGTLTVVLSAASSGNVIADAIRVAFVSGPGGVLLPTFPRPESSSEPALTLVGAYPVTPVNIPFMRPTTAQTTSAGVIQTTQLALTSRPVALVSESLDDAWYRAGSRFDQPTGTAPEETPSRSTALSETEQVFADWETNEVLEVSERIRWQRRN